MYIRIGKHIKHEKQYLFPQSLFWEANSDTNTDRYTYIDTDNDIRNNTITISNTNNATSINISGW